MINITFKNVGQGDSILLEWQNNGVSHYGIIDCNTYGNTNPLLDEIISRKVTNLDFIILSHLHYDHYSGLPGILRHCIDSNIQIELFLHTFTTDFTKILTLMFMNQKVQKDTDTLLETIKEARKKKIIKDFDNVSHNFRLITLYPFVHLKFLAPIGDDYVNLSRQRAAYESGKSTTIPDINSLSTIIEFTNSINSFILTSDATKKTFKRISGVIKNQVLLVQVPHHGSIYNIHERFWQLLSKENLCSSVFSVGDIPKDKLPNKEVVEFFESNGYFNTSTNLVYGLAEHYGTPITPLTAKAIATRSFLSAFSKSRGLSSPSFVMPPRFFGDKSFSIAL